VEVQAAMVQVASLEAVTVEAREAIVVESKQQLTNKNRCRAADTLFGCWTSPMSAL
jgi:hypothetical protein